MKKLTLIILIVILSSDIINAQVEKTTPIVGGTNLSQILENPSDLKLGGFTCDTIFSFKTRIMPSGITWDGQNLWYVDSSFIYKVDNMGTHLDSIENPSTEFYKVGGLTYDGINLWYADEQSAQLFKISPTSGNVLQQYNLPSFGQIDPQAYGIAWDGTNFWVSSYLPPKIYKLDTSGNVLDSLVPSVDILSLAWIDGGLMGITLDRQELFKINTVTGFFEDTTSWCVPGAAGLTWDGSFIWNVSEHILWQGNERIYKLDYNPTLSANDLTNKKNLFEIYPNPTSSELKIIWDEQTLNETHLITISSVSGNIIKTINQGENTLNVDDLPPGVYFIQLIVNEKTITKRFIKQ